MRSRTSRCNCNAGKSCASSANRVRASRCAPTPSWACFHPASRRKAVASCSRGATCCNWTKPHCCRCAARTWPWFSRSRCRPSTRLLPSASKSPSHFPCNATAGAWARRVLKLRDSVGLPAPAALRHSYPFRLSGGQRQRVVIAMALALEPSLLIADEPTTALDVTTQAQILALIRRIQRDKGMGVMFVTHDFGVVAEIAHRVAVMEQGRLVELGPARQLLDAPRHPYTRKLIAAVPHGRAHPPSATAAETVLEVHHLRKTYVTGGGWWRPKRVVVAVDDVSFSVRRGETLGIVGE